MSILIKSDKELNAMRQAGKIVATALKILTERVRPGMKTEELDIIAAEELENRGATPSFKGYHGFPAHLCVSINEEIVHGIPGERIINEGDIVSLDLGAIYNGFHGDAALTIGVGKVSSQAQKLIEVTREALNAGISAARANVRLGDVSATIQDYAESRGYSVVREYAGHGIGREMHEEPQVPNYGPADAGPVLKKGMVLAIEPMVNIGDWRTKVGKDHWTVSTSDGSLSAHFEHTIAITNGEAEVLTNI